MWIKLRNTDGPKVIQWTSSRICAWVSVCPLHHICSPRRNSCFSKSLYRMEYGYFGVTNTSFILSIYISPLQRKSPFIICPAFASHGSGGGPRSYMKYSTSATYALEFPLITPQFQLLKILCQCIFKPILAVIGLHAFFWNMKAKRAEFFSKYQFLICIKVFGFCLKRITEYTQPKF